MKTQDEWMERLRGKTLAWLVDQREPCIRGYNGKEYDAAIDALVTEKIDAGDFIKRYRPSCILSLDEEEGSVEIVEYGGSGGTLRVVHPKE